ncbi:RNA polymerase sigma-70 factor (ECF subfamily) [Luteibacter rhizovicinus]|uniref:RNA polymerase sigma-70 factor (ECF subfamily) n=2 Tax=Luteibacter rhizovicinus TaxID=242606 RepID=A0A4R3YGB6_9GAMM|nr:RNA polymerase sigma-70 factor (ECF subfamily) [Luteibacter rhizovicinus]
MEHEDAEPDKAEPEAMNAGIALDSTLLDVVREVPRSMDAFLAQVERRAWRMAELNLGNREDALDAVQDAMMRLVQHYSGKPAEEWTPLFWGILRRRIVDLQRRRKVRSIVVGWLGGGKDDDGDELPAWEPADEGPDPSAKLQDAQAYNDIATAVRTLPRRQREAFMLRVLEGLDVAETAAAMGCSDGSVKTHLSRAMHALRDQLEAWR